MTRFVVAVLFLVCCARPAAAVPDADAVRKAVEEVGGKITLSPAGDPVGIDLYDGNNPLKGKGVRNLAVNDAWLEHLAGVTTLERLNLANCDVHGPGLEHIAGLTKLKGLGLMLTPVTDEHLVHLAGLVELESLSLASSQCNGTGFAHLRSLTKLADVNMHFTPANDAGIAAVAAMPNLKRLWVAHAHFTDAVAPSLSGMKFLTRLGIGSSEKESSGKALAGIAQVPLTELELLDRQATDEAVSFAAAIPTLRMLGISYGPGVTDAAVDSLLESPALEELKLGQTKITDSGLTRLADLKSLKTLRLTRSKQANQQSWTDAALEHLRTQRPDLTLDVK
ncbi:MAG: hypothetical protein ACKOWG_13140 [Planctomycetia bacterium]